MAVLVSPTEPKDCIKSFDELTSSIPESYGADYMIVTKHVKWGGQRKEFPYDFLSSYQDGRLSKETDLLQSLDLSEVILEGEPSYTKTGILILDRHVPRQYTRAQIEHMVLSVKFAKGIDVVWTTDKNDTISYIKRVEEYLMQDKQHLSLFRRPKPKTLWGTTAIDVTRAGVLQALPSVGPALAGKILEAFGGHLPLYWDCSFEDLLAIPGISKARAEKIWEVFGG